MLSRMEPEIHATLSCLTLVAYCWGFPMTLLTTESQDFIVSLSNRNLSVWGQQDDYRFFSMKKGHNRKMFHTSFVLYVSSLLGGDHCYPSNGKVCM